MYVSMYVCTRSSRLTHATAWPNPCVVAHFKEEKNKLFGQAITRGPSVSTQGAFDNCSLVFDRKGKTKGKLLVIEFSYMAMQNLGSIKWCSLINTKSTSFPWSCCTAKGQQQQCNSLSQQFPHLWRCHHLQLDPAAALCSYSFSLCFYVSYHFHPSNFSRTINRF